jgi:hypothetical protein
VGDYHPSDGRFTGRHSAISAKSRPLERLLMINIALYSPEKKILECGEIREVVVA